MLVVVMRTVTAFGPIFYDAMPGWPALQGTLPNSSFSTCVHIDC